MDRKKVFRILQPGLIGLASFILPFALALLSPNAFIFSESSKEILNEVNNYIEKNIAVYKNYQSFIDSANITLEQKDLLLKLFNKNDELKGKELLKTYFIIQEINPKILPESVDIKYEKAKYQDLTILAILLTIISIFITEIVLRTNSKIKKGLEDLTSNISACPNGMGTAIVNWEKSQKENFYLSIDKNFVDLIDKFTHEHKGFINGIYENYPHNFTKFFDGSINQSDSYNELVKGTRSLYIWMEGIDIRIYAAFAKDLLQFTKENVFSTTYFDIEDLETVLKDENDKLKEWLSSVNRKDNPKLQTKRVHIFHNQDDYSKFKLFLKNNPTIKSFYLNEYAKASSLYKTYLLNLQTSGNKIKFFGEYIIFDTQIMIKYNEDFGLLELFIGSLVKNHSKSFNLDDSHFSIKNASELEKQLNEI